MYTLFGDLLREYFQANKQETKYHFKRGARIEQINDEVFSDQL